MIKINSFSDLFLMDYNISNIIAINQMWNSGTNFTMSNPRPTNAFLFFNGCDAKYFDRMTGKQIYIPQGSLFYIPAGSIYSWTMLNTSPERISTILFEFLLFDIQGNPIQIGDHAVILEITSFELYKDLFKSMVSEFSKPVPVASRIKSSAYYLLASVSGEGRKKHINNEKISCIYPGIQYLEEDPKQSKNIKEIAAMCNMSVNYFERLFKEYAGCTPNQYRLQHKIDRAKLLLANETLNIQQVSNELGFDDCAYFCRVFKKMCGNTPSEYRENQILNT